MGEHFWHRLIAANLLSSALRIAFQPSGWPLLLSFALHITVVFGLMMLTHRKAQPHD